jgi:hypothetical protein
MVLTVAEATPYNFFWTDPIMTFVLGDEKRPNPNPSTAKLIMMDKIAVLLLKNIKLKSPRVTIAMPIVARILASYWSDIRPARGATITIIMGWATRIKPEDSGSNPLIYWR